ncbi:MAG: zinc dependent phospholipase C family protein [Saprospiraceae bacterium]|nr:zinc dependent phospholipase C family protein [Saprospiraceae bacterium]
MPKYGIHHIILKDAITELDAMGIPPATQAAEAMKMELPSSMLGAIGPDLFFWGPDYEVANKIYLLYKNIESVVDLYNGIVQPFRTIKEAVGEASEELVGTLAPSTLALIKQLIGEMKDTAGIFQSAIGTGIFAGILEGGDLLNNAAGVGSLSRNFFQMFVPEVQKNKHETEWYWFDMLHYRKTGEFAKNLVNDARTPRQKAYSFGYLSHIGADVTGHAYTNQVVGTVYRLNVHRHITSENFQDTWKYARYYNGESVNKTLFNRMGLPENLPEDIADLLYTSFHKTYADGDHPKRLAGDGFYTREQLDQTYQLFYEVFKLMDKLSVDRPEEPFSGVMDILSDALNQFSPPPSPPSASSACDWEDTLSFGLTENSRECYEGFFEEIDNWLDYIGELLKWSIETLRNLIDLVTALLLSLPISVLLAILYGIQLLCYQVYRYARLILATNGFVTPEPDELDNSIGRSLITLFQACSKDGKFPSRGFPETNNLVCPAPQIEFPPTVPARHSYGIKSTPNLFIKEEQFSEKWLKIFAEAKSPEETTGLERSIGNATDFSARMIAVANMLPDVGEEAKNILFTNWNLDADRGYGFKTWKGEIPQDEPFEVKNLRYL